MSFANSSSGTSSEYQPLFVTATNDPQFPNFVHYSDDELLLYLLHPNHYNILKLPSVDIQLHLGVIFPKPISHHYDLWIIESLLIQSR